MSARPRSRTPAAVAALIVVIAVAAAVFWRESQQTRAAVGAPAPAFTLPRLDGGEASLSDWQGDVVLLNFWASWCDGCIVEMPALVAFQQRYGHRMALLGVNVQEPVDTAAAFMAEFSVNYPTMLDRQGRTPSRYRLRAYPETWVLDRDGIARYHKPGPMTFEEVAAAYELASGESLSGDHAGPWPVGSQTRAMHVHDGDVWLGGSGGLWRYNGTSWHEAGLPAAADTGVYVIGADGAGGIAVGTGDGLWRSADGIDWDRVDGLPSGPVTGLADRADGLAVWVTGHGLYISADDDWQAVPATLSVAYPWMRLAYGRDGALLAATPDGLTVSDDGGRTWEQTSHRRPAYDLALDGDTVWLAGDDGVHRFNTATNAYEGILPGREKWLSVYGGAPARRLTAIALAGNGVWTTAPTGDVYRREPGIWALVWPHFIEEE